MGRSYAHLRAAGLRRERTGALEQRMEILAENSPLLDRRGRCSSLA